MDIPPRKSSKRKAAEALLAARHSAAGSSSNNLTSLSHDSCATQGHGSWQPMQQQPLQHSLHTASYPESNADQGSVQASLECGCRSPSPPPSTSSIHTATSPNQRTKLNNNNVRQQHTAQPASVHVSGCHAGSACDSVPPSWCKFDVSAIEYHTQSS